MQLFVEIQGVADLLQGDESFTSAAEVWLVADTLKRTGPRSGELGGGPVHAERVGGSNYRPSQVCRGSTNLVCVKDSLIFRDAPFLMANDAGAVLATRFGVIAVAVKDWGIHEHELIPEAPSMGKSVSRRNCAPLQSGQLYPSSHR